MKKDGKLATHDEVQIFCKKPPNSDPLWKFWISKSGWSLQNIFGCGQNEIAETDAVAAMDIGDPRCAPKRADVPSDCPAQVGDLVVLAPDFKVIRRRR